MAVVRARSSPPYALISTVVVAVAATALAVMFYLNAHAQALRGHPRWPALASMMNLPQEA